MTWIMVSGNVMYMKANLKINFGMEKEYIDIIPVKCMMENRINIMSMDEE